MGTRIIKTDDVTGREVGEGDLAAIEVMFGELWTGTVELTQASQDAVLALLRDHDTTKLAKLIGPTPTTTATTARRTRKSGSHGSGDHAKAREWCQDTAEGQAAKAGWEAEHDKLMPTNGRMPQELVERYQQSQMAQAA